MLPFNLKIYAIPGNKACYIYVIFQLQVNLTKTYSWTLTQYVKSLYSLNEGLCSVAQSLLAHTGVRHRRIYADTHVHSFCQTNFMKPGAWPPAGCGCMPAWFKTSGETREVTYLCRYTIVDI